MTRSFEATDGSGKETVPASEIATGAVGYCLVFDNIRDAVNFDSNAEVKPFVIDEVE